MLLFLVALSVVSVFEASAAHTGSKLPPWIQPCYRDDPKFDKCAVINGQNSIPRLAKGDKKIRLPIMDPLEIVEMRLDSSATHLGLDIVLSNVSIFGLANTVLTDFHADFDKQDYSVNLLIPTMEVMGMYNISGRILVLPVTGAGRGNITLKNVRAKFDFYCNLKESLKDSKNHLKVMDYTLAFNTTRVYTKLDNLFNGDKLLGSAMNQFMNDNWQELVGNIGPVISDALGGVLVQIFNVILDLVPFDDIVPLSPKALE